MKTRKFVILFASVAAMMAGQAALGHVDQTADQTRCDTWYRPGHGTEPTTDNPDTHQGNSHHHTSSSDVSALGFVVHAHSGHYVVRHQYAYTEVVGGQSYTGPTSQGYGQGGWVQGEVDPGIGQDADFHANAFGPVEPNAPVGDRGNTGGQVCVTIGNTRVTTGQITVPTGS